jgi:hypothetical protein
MAKVSPRPPKAAGVDAPSGERRRQAQPPSAAGGGCSLVYAPYWAAAEREAPPLTGRHWGVFNRKVLPVAERNFRRISFALAELARREAMGIWPGIDPESPLGFTLFTEKAEGLYDWLLENDVGEDKQCLPE